MRCYIFTGPKNYDVLRHYQTVGDDLVIGADQGALYLAEHEISFDVALGDFDSISESEFNIITSFAKEVVTHPEKKDFTDTYLAIQEALKRGADDIVIIGGLGARFDHSYANVHALMLGNIKLIDDTTLM